MGIFQAYLLRIRHCEQCRAFDDHPDETRRTSVPKFQLLKLISALHGNKHRHALLVQNVKLVDVLSERPRLLSKLISV